MRSFYSKGRTGQEVPRTAGMRAKTDGYGLSEGRAYPFWGVALGWVIRLIKELSK